MAAGFLLRVVEKKCPFLSLFLSLLKTHTNRHIEDDSHWTHPVDVVSYPSRRSSRGGWRWMRRRRANHAVPTHPKAQGPFVLRAPGFVFFFVCEYQPSFHTSGVLPSHPSQGAQLLHVTRQCFSLFSTRMDQRLPAPLWFSKHHHPAITVLAKHSICFILDLVFISP